MKMFFFFKGVFFKCKVGEVYVVKGISFDVCEGEIMVIVGEFGSGKMMMLFQIMDMIKQIEGDIVIVGMSVNDICSCKVECVFCCDIQIVFQDLMGVFDLCMMVVDIIFELLLVIGMLKVEIQ